MSLDLQPVLLPLLEAANSAELDAVDGRCAGCARDTHELGESYMVHDEVWLEAMSSRRGVLCVGCLETLLGRTLSPQDFTVCVLNGIAVYRDSDRLRDRLTRRDGRFATCLAALAAAEYYARTTRPTPTTEKP